MRRSRALSLLAPTHARIVRLADDGLDTGQLADRLSLDSSAVDPLLRVARQKLAALEALDDHSEPKQSRPRHEPTSSTTRLPDNPRR
jgi:DNA-directed RNA polymerase specialized sigma24 family protein